ncbi:MULTISPECIES: TolB family protein [Streptomyces]|uniref:Uncharacterized protein n=2 Tax=Streptomyces rimosus subsp. rimosus TaxID=132474 RepID=L8EI19_STRR1|nr:MULTISPECIES: TolB family protein [Streptomyces]KOG80155.1 hypothetical protein ADK78_05870 [Kitasatospora aureofaciens]MYT43946.1 hypothetical protein [Streptomyces sp. SID5471]KEF08450.1 hypothetical protein DF17_04945 [Streptomyces rimosus]KEF20719.1 hypothetical protein DF18_09920 [Streptomyces rimosus]KOT26392.1 hypothetical protein ADK42_38745 [Streptomyces rimosus subsp. rimosus]
MRRRGWVAGWLGAGALVLTACGGGGEGPPHHPSESARPSPGTADSPSAKPAERRGDGAELIHRESGKGSAQNPAFAPDGKSLLFTVFHGGYNEGAAALRVLPLAHRDGRDSRTAVRDLLDEHDRAAVNLPGSSWRPSAGVTFASDRAGKDEIWVLRPGGRPERVTEHPGNSGYLEPSFSPDGKWIVFQESVEREDPDEKAALADRSALGSLWKVRRDGTEQTRLVNGPASRTDNREPNWSPRGDRLVFQRRELGSDAWALYVMNADGSGVRKLTTVAGEHTDASWSPDGRSVVFSSTTGGLALPKIFVMPVSGGAPVQVTRDPGTYDGAPSWSPDGRWIAFESHPGSEDRPTSLWRVPAPGKQ